MARSGPKPRMDCPGCGVELTEATVARGSAGNRQGRCGPCYRLYMATAQRRSRHGRGQTTATGPIRSRVLQDYAATCLDCDCSRFVGRVQCEGCGCEEGQHITTATEAEMKQWQADLGVEVRGLRRHESAVV